MLHGSDAGVRDRWTPLFDTYDVDIVINGHNHMYDSAPIRSAAAATSRPSHRRERRCGRPQTARLSWCRGWPRRTNRCPIGRPGRSRTGTDFGLLVPEATPWSAFVDELSPVVICVEADPVDRTGITTMKIRSVDAATNTVVDSVTLERQRRHARA